MEEMPFFNDPDKDKLLELFLQHEEPLHAHVADPIPKTLAEGPIPCSYAQQRLWFLNRLFPDIPVYHMPFAVTVTGSLHLSLVKESLERICKQHAVLRTKYSLQKGKLMQEIIPFEDFSMDFSIQISTGDSEKQVMESIRKFVETPFDLSDGHVFRVRIVQVMPQHYILACCFHHIVADLISIRKILDELSSIYSSILAGEILDLDPVSIQYADYCCWQAQAPQEKLWMEQLTFWRAKLQGAPALFEMPASFQRPAIQTFRGNTFSFIIDEKTTALLKDLSKYQQSSLYATLLTTYAILLYRYSSERDLVIGTPVSIRDRADITSLVGLFLNMLPLRLQVDPKCSFIELLRETKEVFEKAFINRALPFEKLVEELDIKRNLSTHPIFQVLFSLQYDQPEDLILEGTTISPYPFPWSYSKFDLSLLITERGNSLKADLEYSTDLFTENYIEQLAAHYTNLLQAILRFPGKAIGQLNMLTNAEYSLLKSFPTDAYKPCPERLTINDLIRESFEQHPDKVAVSDSQTKYSYRELQAKANHLASYLLEKSACKQKVAVLLARSADLWVAVLAIWKIGAVYVPLDEDYPAHRMEYILKDSGAEFLITEPGLVGLAGNITVEAIFFHSVSDRLVVDAAWFPPVDPHSLAYIIYTSGSTGEPKGVMICHRSLANFLHSMLVHPGISSSDIVLAVTTITFDISILEMMLPLVAGASVVIAPRQIVMDGKKLADAIDHYGINWMQATPTLWKILIDTEWEPALPFTVLSGGEPLSSDLAKRLLQPGVDCWNMYGPTETTIWSALWKVENDPREVLVGNPVANTSIYILDENKKILPAEVPGHVYIGGEGLAIGYNNKPALTLEKFENISLDNDTTVRLYNSGDIGVRKENGCFKIIGREDFQVKINGYRIEPGEPEAVLKTHPDIKDCLVLPECLNNKTTRLIAYIVARDQVLSVSDLYRYLKDRIPSHMIPSRFLYVGNIPMLPSGKADRKALTALASAQYDPSNNYVAPGTDAQKILCDIWAKVLGLEQIGITDNFFESGGASLQCVEVVNLAQQRNISLTVEMLFRYQTVEELAAEVNLLSSSEGMREIATTEKTEHLLPALPNIKHSEIECLQIDKVRTNIEMFHVYLPDKAVTTKELMQGCKVRLGFPLEKLSGIYSRPVAEGEYSIDLAAKAVAGCLARSAYSPEHIELLICCNISRYDGERRFSFEPGTAVRLKTQFGLKNAVVMDLTNACAGIFTGIRIADQMIRNKTIRCAMLVSGEYITHLGKTAQEEINSFFDERLACLTLGDSGLAIILDDTAVPGIGFDQIDLFTLGAYSKLCTASISKESGGPVMFTDSVNLTRISLQHGTWHTLDYLQKQKVSINTIDHLIMHQTSSTSLKDARREINKKAGKEICTENNTIDNLKWRGNTSTTSHFIALFDHILNGNVRDNEKIFFSISGSGIVLGSTVYSLGDLPGRIRKNVMQNPVNFSPLKEPSYLLFKQLEVPVHLTGIGLPESAGDTFTMLHHAAKRCLELSDIPPEEVDVMIHAGIYREDFLSEPALAAMLAGMLQPDVPEYEKSAPSKTLAFDIMNGTTGWLSSIFIASQLLQDQSLHHAMITTSDIENNKTVMPGQLLGIYESASATLLSNSQRPGHGFSNFFFACFPEYIDLFRSYATWQNGSSYLHVDASPGQVQVYLSCISSAIQKFIQRTNVGMEEIDWLFAPQISPEFIHTLCGLLSFPVSKAIISPLSHLGNLYTSSIPCALWQHSSRGAPKTGNWLLIEAGTGGQVALAFYQGSPQHV